MTKTSLRILPAALAFAFASAGLSAMAQNTAAPSTTEKVEKESKEAWDATKSGSKKAWNATKHGTKKAADATGHAAHKTGEAIGNAGGAAADATRKAGDKIGEQIPGTAQHDAKKP
jgi:hypothetical protein